MKYDIGDIIIYKTIQKYFIIECIYNVEGVLFYDIECLESREKSVFSSKTLDRSFGIVQKVNHEQKEA